MDNLTGRKQFGERHQPYQASPEPKRQPPLPQPPESTPRPTAQQACPSWSCFLRYSWRAKLVHRLWWPSIRWPWPWLCTGYTVALVTKHLTASPDGTCRDNYKYPSTEGDEYGTSRLNKQLMSLKQVTESRLRFRQLGGGASSTNSKSKRMATGHLQGQKGQ